MNEPTERPPDAVPAVPAPANPQPGVLGLALGYYGITSVLVVLAITLASLLLPTFRNVPAGPFLSYFTRWDGEEYVSIVQAGFQYDNRDRNTVAFFPAYPLLGRLFAWLPGVSPRLGLLLVSHLCLAAAFVLMALYVRQRFATAPVELTEFVLLSLGLWPVTFFFRMAYSESLFLLVTLATLYALERRWPLVVVALLAGLTTAVRPVGVALLAPLLLAVWQRSPDWPRFMLRTVGLLPLAVWGLLAYMLFNWLRFDDPLIFARAQSSWTMPGQRPLGLGERVRVLLTLEPFWCLFDPSSTCYWGERDPDQGPWLSLYLANPVFLLATAALIVVGLRQRWLTAHEGLLSALLLLIPYLTRSYEMCMASQARFAAVAFPVYLVLGQLLWRLPRGLALGLLGLSGLLLVVYAARFGLYYPFFL